MSSPQPESGTEERPDAYAGRTDFQSLTAPPIAERAPARQREATDFRSLQEGTVPARRRYQDRTITDWLVDFLTPFMIFVMVYSVIFFLLDIRYVYLGVATSMDPMVRMNDGTLKWVALCFVIGVVALNRLIARDGRDESMIYIGGLAMAIGLYTFSTTRSTGSVAGSFMNSPYLATLFNMFLVALVWWLTNRLTHECCVDGNPTAGDIGIFTGTARRVQQAMGRASQATRPAAGVPKNEPFILTMTIDAVDPGAARAPNDASAPPPPPPPATRRLPRRHPGISVFYVSVPAMFAFAVGQRVLLNGDPGLRMRAHGFIIAYTVAALALLMLSSLGGLRQYFRERRVTVPGGLGPFWIGLGAAMIALVVFGAARMPSPGLPHPAAIPQPAATAIESGKPEPRDRSSNDAHGSNRNAQAQPASQVQSKTSAPDPDASENRTPDGQVEQAPNTTDDSRASASARQKTSRSSDRQMPELRLPEFGNVTRVVGVVVIVVMVIFGIFVLLRILSLIAFALAGGHGRGSNALRRFFAALDRFLQRITRLPALPKFHRRVRVDRSIAFSTQYRNPFRDETTIARMSPGEIVEYSYAALCALARDMGVPREDGQTPDEFIKTFPDSLKTLREDSQELTRLYVLSAYSNIALDPGALDRVRGFWHGYDRVRAGVLR